MKEIGEYLKTERKKNGVSISEASDDLNINETLLKAIEDGNSKAFKDIFELKEMVRNYSKYLGLDVESMLDEFNDYIFEKTSKISLEDIKNASNNHGKLEETTVKVSSPYTKIKHTRYDVAPIVLLVAILLFISLIVYLALKIIKNEPVISEELQGKEVVYENI
ncbi:MAG: helix-turn-helix domain-containing protein [Bacilli bacterium]|nr:helix-turn-helix domain-containing protein [Bacilli bacterium]